MNIEEYPIDRGRYLIEASAGTGKTWTITHLFLRLVLNGTPVSKILVTTFTNNGAAELKERIVKLLNESLHALDPSAPDAKKQELRLRLAVSSIDEMTIGTIHSFCQKMLREYVLESGTGFNETLIPNESKYRDRLVRAFSREKYYRSEDGPEKIDMAKLQKAAACSSLGKITSGPAGNELREAFEYVRSRLDREKEQDGVLSFDDVIRLFHDAVEQDPRLAEEIGKKYQAVFVDEFQDTDRTQFEIFDRCFPKNGKTLFYMIGDPKQAIYAFRGADIYTYLDAKKTADMPIPLSKNFRSTPQMIEAVNRIFGGVARPEGLETNGMFLQTGIPYITVASGHQPGKRFPHAVKNALRLRHYAIPKEDAEKKICEDVVNEIRWLLSEGCGMLVDEEVEDENGGKKIDSRPLKASDIVVLVQKHEHAAEFLRLLNLAGIPASACKSGKIYDSQEAAVMFLLLKCMLEPTERNIRGLLVSPFFRFTAAQLVQEDYDLERIAGTLNQMTEEWRNSGLPSAFLHFLDTPLTGKLTPRIQLMSDPCGERSVTNYLQLMELLYEKESREHLPPEDVLNYLHLALSGQQDENGAAGLGNDDNPDQLRLDRDSAAVQLMTMFAAKGMEFPVVFIPFPAKTSGDYLIGMETACKIRDPEDGSFLLDFAPEDEHKAVSFSEALRSQLRLLYVALTRGSYVTYLYTQERPNGTSQKINFTNSAQGVILTDPGAVAGRTPSDYRSNGENLPEPLAEWFRQLVIDGQDSWEVFEKYPDHPAGRLRSGDLSADQLAAGSLPSVPDRWCVMSFSSYCSQWNHTEDEEDDAESPADRDSQKSPDEQPQVRTLPGTFRDFPRGDRVGTMVHDLLEGLNGKFSAFAPDAPPETTAKMKELIRQTLSGSGYDPETLAGPLYDGICRALQTPLPGIGTPLCRIRNYMQETEFFLDAENGLDLHGILKIMKNRASEAVRQQITCHVVPFGKKGMVNGLTDLIFEHEGKYYIVDWKTNHLGRKDSDYAPDRIMDAMIEEKYVLQAYLYSAALLRLLRRNGIPDDRFGGVFYLFIRGMGPGGQNGIWYDIPPLECLDAMLKLFQRGE